MSAPPNPVTDETFTREGNFEPLHRPVTDVFREPPFLPLHHRQVWKTVAYFYCSKCGREKQFSWFDAFCTQSGELLCLACTSAFNFDKDKTGWKLCRRCRRPRRVGKDSQFTYPYVQYPDHNTICDECRSVNWPAREPLQAVCARCGKPFTAKRSDARFCSGRCRTAAHRAVTAENADLPQSSRNTDRQDGAR
jgi:endogenous inhibitor of DNA gyrase (YacG/DUF329 family)